MDKKYLVDFDGVILDSQERFQAVMQDNKDFYDWMEYLISIEWHSFLRECEEIDESLSVLQQLQKYQRLHAIITAIHSLKEGQEKLIYLRERGIEVPVIYTLPHQKKNEVFIPTPEFVLVDDKPKNCQDWVYSGGDALIFDRYLKEDTPGRIRSLKDLL